MVPAPGQPLGAVLETLGCSHLGPMGPFPPWHPSMQPLCPSRPPGCPTHVSLALPGLLQGLVASLAEKCCPCPSLSVPRLCPGYKPVEIEALCPWNCLCPGASCRDRVVPPLSDNIPIWALVDFIDPQPAPCYAEPLSPAQPCHQQLSTYLCLTPASSQCKALPDPILSNQ